MPGFLITATNRDGYFEPLHIEAETAQAACAQVESQGYTDIALHTDDVAAAITRLMPPPDKETLPPAQMFVLRCLSDWGFFRSMFFKSCIDWWWLWTLGTAGLGCTLGIRGNLGVVGTSALMALAWPLVMVAGATCFAAWATCFRDVRKHEALLEARYWGRWEEVLKKAKALRGAVSDLELDLWSAIALAGLGRAEEGLALMAPYAENPDMPKWLYYHCLGAVYEPAHECTTALEYHRQSYDDAPEIPSIALLLADALLSNEVETSRAIELIDFAETQYLCETLKLVLPFAKGLAALNMADYEEAAQYLQQAEDGVFPEARACDRFMLDVSRALRAIALARMGEFQQAETLFESARPRLEALNAERILTRYANAAADQ